MSSTWVSTEQQLATSVPPAATVDQAASDATLHIGRALAALA